ncbi:MAG: dTMP kinase [Spirochaetales bacterium]|nr:dTMP kinase [Spirochaetales bacterium]
MVLKNFIVFEGIDGSGTTTQLKRLAETNPELYYQTAEPTSLPTGLFLRKMLKGEFSVDEKTNAFLFAADRCEHIYGKEGIINQINNGKIVISDRYFFSSLAYQSISCGEEFPLMVNSLFPLPEYLFYFKIDAETALNRVNSRNGQKEIYEKLDLQKKIAEQYDKVISSYEKKMNELSLSDAQTQIMKIIKIDASKSIDEVSQLINKALNLQ